jgi:hypothetical protein
MLARAGVRDARLAGSRRCDPLHGLTLPPSSLRPAERRPAERRPAERRPAERRPAERRPAWPAGAGPAARAWAGRGQGTAGPLARRAVTAWTPVDGAAGVRIPHPRPCRATPCTASTSPQPQRVPNHVEWARALRAARGRAAREVRYLERARTNGRIVRTRSHALSRDTHRGTADQSPCLTLAPHATVLRSPLTEYVASVAVQTDGDPGPRDASSTHQTPTVTSARIA